MLPPDKKSACAQVHSVRVRVATHCPQLALNNRPYNISETPATPRQVFDLWNILLPHRQLKNIVQNPLAPILTRSALRPLPPNCVTFRHSFQGSARGGPR